MCGVGVCVCGCVFVEMKKIIFNDKKKRMKKMLLKNLELENRLMFQVLYLFEFASASKCCSCLLFFVSFCVKKKRR